MNWQRIYNNMITMMNLKIVMKMKKMKKKNVPLIKKKMLKPIL